MTFEESLRVGQANEQAVMFIPEMRSFYLTPLTKLAMDGAPRMVGLSGEHKPMGFILPDYHVAHQKYLPVGLECKLKDDSTKTHITGEREHGIGRRVYLHYRQFGILHRCKVILAFTEQSTGEILAATIEKLETGWWLDTRDGLLSKRPRLYFGNKMDRGGMAFFGRSQFMVLHQFEPRDLPLFKGQSQLVPPTLPHASDFGELS
jgi:hypothetical protein